MGLWRSCLISISSHLFVLSDICGVIHTALVRSLSHTEMAALYIVANPKSDLFLPLHTGHHVICLLSGL